MSHIPIQGPKQSPPQLLLAPSSRQKSPFLGLSLIHDSQELSQSLAAWTTWRADEETLLVVLFGFNYSWAPR